MDKQNRTRCRKGLSVIKLACILLSGIVFATCYFSANSANALSMEPVTKNILAICMAPANKGSYWDVQIKGSGDANVKLKLADGSLSVEAMFRKGEWNGVQQVIKEQQASENANYRICTEKLTSLFLEKFYTKSDLPTKPAPTNPTEGESESSTMEIVAWTDLSESAKSVEGFAGQAWFCQAQTFTGKTECHFGTKPPKPGRFVILNRNRTAWIAVKDAAKQLHVDFHMPDDGKNINRSSGYGCGVPSSNDFWLLVSVN